MANGRYPRPGRKRFNPEEQAKESFNVMLTPDLAERLKNQAEILGMSRSKLIDAIARDYLAKVEPQKIEIE